MKKNRIFLYLGLFFTILSPMFYFNESLHFLPLKLKFTLLDIGGNSYLGWIILAYVWYLIYGLDLIRKQCKSTNLYIFTALAVFGIVTQIIRWNYFFQGLNQGSDFLYGIPLFFYGMILCRKYTVK